MKIFTNKQIAEIDQLTIQFDSILSIDLMEQASTQAADWIINNIGNDRPFWFFAGPGNNGGDALAIARILAGFHFNCTVFIAAFGRELKGDPAINLQRLEDHNRVLLKIINLLPPKEQNNVLLKIINSEESIPEIPSGVFVIDGLFGSGLNKPLDGLAEKIVCQINQSGATVISIDIPSGLFGENNSHNNLSAIIRANHTLTFQFPKISFFFPENYQYTGDWEMLPIGLSPEAIRQTESNYFFLTKEFISAKIKKRGKFSHKGTYGHALLIAGSYGKMGAAVLASKACLRSGVGLLTSHIPRLGYEIIQNSVPEAMTSIDTSDTVFSQIPVLSPFNAVGIGPGLDKKPESQIALKELLLAKPPKLVIDADALNILSENQDWYTLLPGNAILTPHPKEFERLAGSSANSYERIQIQLQFSKKYQVIVICKGAFTTISLPDGRIFFNNTGNPGMATGGSGDVLTGIILGLLAQNYTPEEAALIGVFIHGMAGDLAAIRYSQQSMIAGDLIEQIGAAFLRL